MQATGSATLVLAIRTTARLNVRCAKNKTDDCNTENTQNGDFGHIHDTGRGEESKQRRGMKKKRHIPG